MKVGIPGAGRMGIAVIGHLPVCDRVRGVITCDIREERLNSGPLRRWQILSATV